MNKSKYLGIAFLTILISVLFAITLWFISIVLPGEVFEGLRNALITFMGIIYILIYIMLAVEILLSDEATYKPCT